MLVLDSSAAISLVFERPEAAKLRPLTYEGEKVIAFKFQKRKRYKRTKGHRQQLTKLKITDIQAA